MYAFYLLFSWMAHHEIWTSLGAFVMLGTMAIVWFLDKPL